MRSEEVTEIGLPHYRIDGDGSRLVLLHPVGLDLTFFDPLVAELSPFYQVLRIDLRGHGKTSAWKDRLPQLEDYAEDVHGLLHRLNFAPAAVAGFSFGGMIAQELALNYPDDVSALVISACPSTFNEETRRALLQRGDTAKLHGMSSVLDTTICRWFSRAFRSLGGDVAARRRLLDDDIQGWSDAWHAIAGLHTAPRLSRLHIPTLCLAAEEDISAPPPVVEMIAKAISGSRFVVIPEAPHMLFIEAPTAVASEIRGFLAQTLPSD